VRGRSNQQMIKRLTACVCSFEIRFDGLVCLHYLALLQHFSSIRTRLNNRRSTSLSSTQRKRPLGRMQQWINDRVAIDPLLWASHRSSPPLRGFLSEISFASTCIFSDRIPGASPFNTRISNPGVAGPNSQHCGASPARIAALSSLKRLRQFSCVSCLSWFPFPHRIFPSIASSGNSGHLRLTLGVAFRINILSSPKSRSIRITT
jgi:hypothetical protein